jgi:hypothetical protein
MARSEFPAQLQTPTSPGIPCPLRRDAGIAMGHPLVGEVIAIAGIVVALTVIMVAPSGSQALSAPSLVSVIVASRRPRPGGAARRPQAGRHAAWVAAPSRSGYLIEVGAFAVTDG